jgi:hypothetical protein
LGRFVKRYESHLTARAGVASRAGRIPKGVANLREWPDAHLNVCQGLFGLRPVTYALRHFTIIHHQPRLGFPGHADDMPVAFISVSRIAA